MRDPASNLQKLVFTSLSVKKNPRKRQKNWWNMILFRIFLGLTWLSKKGAHLHVYAHVHNALTCLNNVIVEKLYIQYCCVLFCYRDVSYMKNIIMIRTVFSCFKDAFC